MVKLELWVADIAIEGWEICNDNSIYTLMRLIPNSSGYSREVVWMEKHINGKDSRVAIGQDLSNYLQNLIAIK